MANLGTLTLDLVAKTGGFTGPLERAGRTAKSTAGSMKADFAVVGTAAAGAAAAAAAALIAMTAEAVKASGEITRFAQVSGTGVEEFQRYAAGARAVGVEQEKLGDIFKDASEKVGDFVATGGGELADFFEKIAPAVGVTADQFRELSGPQALELYVSSLEKAGVSQNEMIFYLESIASDASLLLPLLRNNAEGFRLFGDAASEAGAILSSETIMAAQEFSATLDLADMAMEGLKNQITSAMLPVLSDLASEFFNTAQDGMDLTGVADAITAALKGAAAIAVGGAGAFQLLGKSLGGVAAIVASIPDGFDAIGRAREIVQQDLEETARATGESINRILNAGGEGGTNETVKKLVEIRTEQGRIQSSSRSLTQAQVESSEKSAKAAEDAAKKAQAAWEESYRTQLDLAREVAAVVESTFTDQQRALDEYQQKVQTLRQGVIAGVISEEDASNAVGLLDSQLTQRLDELGETTGTFWEEWLSAAEENLTSFDELSASVIENFGAGVGSAFEDMLTGAKDIDEALLNLAQNTIQSVVGALGQMAAQWVALQAVQMVLGKSSEAAALAGAAATGAGMAAAYAPAAALASLASFGANSAPAIAGMTAATTTAQGLALLGMAHDGIDSVPQTGTWLLEKGERVTTAETSAKLDQTLDDVQRNRQSSSPTINIIEDASKAGRTQTRTGPNNEKMIDVFVSNLMEDGRVYRAMNQKFGIQGVGR